MGDRANIEMRESGGGKIYLYSHWAGSELPQMLCEALQFAKARWDDEQYLHRCIITHICKDEDGVTGWGVSTYPGDGEDRITIVDTPNRKVKAHRGEWMTFEEFVS